MKSTDTTNSNDAVASKHWIQKVGRLSAPLLLGQLLSKGLNFVVFYLITQYLGLEGFGVWVWAFSLVAVAAAAWSFGLQTWLAKTSAQITDDISTVPDLFRKVITVRVCALMIVSVTGAAWLFLMGLPSHTPEKSQLIIGTLFAIFVGFLFRTTSEVCGAYLRGQLLTWPDGVALFTARFAFVTLLLGWSITTPMSLQSVGSCFCLSEAIAAIVMLFLFFQKTSITLKSQAQNTSFMTWRTLLQQVSLYGGLLIGSAFLFRVGILFGGHHLSTTDLGTFAVIHRLNEFSLFLPEAFAAVLLPLWTQSQMKSGATHGLKTTALMAILGVGVGSVLFLIGPWVLPLVFEQEYRAVIPWLWVVVPLFGLQFANQSFLAQFMSQNQEKQALALLVFAGVFALIGLGLWANNSMNRIFTVILCAEGLFTFGAFMQRNKNHDSN